MTLHPTSFVGGCENKNKTEINVMYIYTEVVFDLIKSHYNSKYILYYKGQIQLFFWVSCSEYSLCMIHWCYVIYYIYIKSHVSWFREFFFVSHTHLSQIRHAKGSPLLWCLLLGMEISSLTYFVRSILFSCSMLSGVLMAWGSSFCSASMKEMSEWLQKWFQIIRIIRKYVLNYMNRSISTFSPYYLYTKQTQATYQSSYILAKF